MVEAGEKGFLELVPQVARLRQQGTSSTEDEIVIETVKLAIMGLPLMEVCLPIEPNEWRRADPYRALRIPSTDHRVTVAQKVRIHRRRVNTAQAVNR